MFKPLVFFDDEESFKKFENNLLGVQLTHRLDIKFPWKPVTKGIVAYAFSEQERDKILETFRKIAEKANIKCRILYRHAGRYWQDLFPEFFGKEIEGYRPFYSDLFEFRKRADKLETQERIESLAKKLFRLQWVSK